MTKKESLFSSQDRAELKKRLNHLRMICCPPASTLKPSIRFKDQKDFQFDDYLKWTDFNSPTYPSELKNIWQDRQTLRSIDIDYMVVDGQKWFFNLRDKIGNFFSQDGSRKVEIEFPYWMEMTNVFRTPGVRAAIFDTLTLASNGKTPTQKQAKNCFSDELCQRIYRKNPSREAIEIAVLEMTEVFRKKTIDYLKQNHVADILKEPSFKEYAKTGKISGKTPDFQKVGQFLSAQKPTAYILAEKYGLIKKGRRMALYEDIRDHARHQELPEKQIDPYKIYEDFCLALKEPVELDSKAYRLSRFGNNIDVALHLSCLNFIWTILEQYIDPSLKKKRSKPEYFEDLIQKGILKSEEKGIFESIVKPCNSVAHVDGRVKNARSKVMHDRRLFELVNTLHDRHIQLQRN